MLKNKKALAMSVLCAIASVGFVVSASAADQTMHGNLDEVVVEGSADVLPGGMANAKGSVGLLGDKEVMETPFSVTNVSQKTMDLFLGPNEPLDKALVGVPGVRASGSVLHGDFSLRGFRTNGTAMYVNGVHGVMTQFNLPMFAMEGVDVVSGPNSMLGASGVQYESNTAGGIVNARTKRAGDTDFVKYKQTFSGKGSFGEYLDVSQRLGENREWGVRLNTELLNGETAVDEANMKAKGIAVNIDHKDKNSSTNFFANYRDLDIYNGIRWFKLANSGHTPVDKNGNPTLTRPDGSKVDKDIPGVTHLPSAPDGGKNYSAAGTWKAGYGWFATLNHEQYMNDNWTLFANFGYSRQKLNQNVSPNMSSYWITDDTGNYDFIQTNSATPQRSYYAQLGTKNKFETGALQHEVMLSTDKAWRNRNGSDTVPGTRYIGGSNIFTGSAFQDVDARYIGYTTRPNNKTSIWGVSLLDSISFGKWDAMVGIHKHAATAKSWNTKIKSWNKEIKSDATCPTYSLSYAPDDHVMIYGNHAENFDIGASAGSDYQNYGEVLPPAKVKQNEVGVKYQNKGAMYTLAYFDIDQANNVSKEVAGYAKPFLVQDGKVNHKGLELAVNGQLADKWYGMVGVAYLDAKYKNMGKGNEFKNGVRESGQGEWSASAALEYKADDNFSVIGRATYTGSTPFYTVKYNTSTVTKDSKHLEAPAYMVYDLGVTYNTKINTVPVKLSAMCYNLLDKDYWTVARGDQVYLSTPRTFFVSAEFTL